MTRRVPQYVRCDLCNHTWIGVWMPMVSGDPAQVLESLRCPMCASDSSYHKLHNDHGAVLAAAEQCTDPPVRLSLSLDVESDLSSDIRLFMCKTQIGDPLSACQHTRAVTFLTKLPQWIDTAAGYARAKHAKAGA